MENKKPYEVVQIKRLEEADEDDNEDCKLNVAFPSVQNIS
jgi:hypothetical protein